MLRAFVASIAERYLDVAVGAAERQLGLSDWQDQAAFNVEVGSKLGHRKISRSEALRPDHGSGASASPNKSAFSGRTNECPRLRVKRTRH
jgi:hypothetical protein